MIKRIKTGIVLKKENLADGEILEAAIREILSDERYNDFKTEKKNRDIFSYTARARKIGEMIRNRPFNPRDTFVKNMEFMARYGPLR